MFELKNGETQDKKLIELNLCLYSDIIKTILFYSGGMIL